MSFVFAALYQLAGESEASAILGRLFSSIRRGPDTLGYELEVTPGDLQAAHLPVVSQTGLPGFAD